MGKVIHKLGLQFRWTPTQCQLLAPATTTMLPIVDFDSAPWLTVSAKPRLLQLSEHSCELRRTGDEDFPFSRWREALSLPAEDDVEIPGPVARRARKQRKPSAVKPVSEVGSPTKSIEPCARQMWVTPTLWERVDWGSQHLHEAWGRRGLHGKPWRHAPPYRHLRRTSLRMKELQNIGEPELPLPGPHPRSL